MNYSNLKKDLNISSLNSEDLLSPVNFESVKFLAYKLVDNQDFDGALNYARILDQKLQSYRPEATEQKHYRVLKYWVSLLLLFAISNLTIKEVADLLKNRSWQMVSSGLDVRKALYKYLNFFETDSTIKDYSNILLNSLKNNQELVGQDIDAFSNKHFQPTVTNWLKEYQMVLHLDSGELALEPGAFNIVKFMDSSQYIKYLTSAEKESLNDLLDLYNWLYSPIAEANVTEQRSSRPFMNRAQATLPANLIPLKVPSDSQPSAGIKFEIPNDLVKSGGMEKLSIRAAKVPMGGDGGEKMTVEENKKANIINSPSSSIMYSSVGMESPPEVAEEIDEKLEMLKEKADKRKKS